MFLIPFQCSAGLVGGLTGQLETSALGAAELKKNSKFKLGGSLNMKLKKKPATKARKGVNPSPKSHVSSRPSQPARPCVFSQ